MKYYIIHGFCLASLIYFEGRIQEHRKLFPPKSGDALARDLTKHRLGFDVVATHLRQDFLVRSDLVRNDTFAELVL
jgi:hypothetical protein